MSISSSVFSWAYTNLLHTKRVFDRINSNFESVIIVSFFITIYLVGVHRTEVTYIVLLLAEFYKRSLAVRISIIRAYVQFNKCLRTPTLEKNVLSYVVLYDWLTIALSHQMCFMNHNGWVHSVPCAKPSQNLMMHATQSMLTKIYTSL